MTEFAVTVPARSSPLRRAVTSVTVLSMVVVISTGCTFTKKIITEQVLRRVEPIRLECPAESLLAGITSSTRELRDDAPVVRGLDSLLDRRTSIRYRKIPATIESSIPRVKLPFSPATPPLVVIARDLNRIMESHGGVRIVVPDSAAGPTPAGVLSGSMLAHLLSAQSHGTIRPVPGLLGQVVIDVGIFSGASASTIAQIEPAWKARFVGQSVTRPGYAHAAQYAAALQAGYCAALRQFADSVAAPNGGIQRALRR